MDMDIYQPRHKEHPLGIKEQIGPSPYMGGDLLNDLPYHQDVQGGI